MTKLYIYAHPVQMITFQMVNSNNEIISNENCSFENIVRITAKYHQDENINQVYVVGDTVFADKVGSMIRDNLKNINVERIKND